MRTRSILAAAAVISASLIPTSVPAQSGYGQVQLVNQMPDTALDLYIGEDTYGCRALSGLTCTTMVPAGVHVVWAKAPDGRATPGEQIDLASGGTFTLTIEPIPE